MEAVVFKAISFSETDKREIARQICMSSEERQEIARQLRERVFGKNPPAVRASCRKK